MGSDAHILKNYKPWWRPKIWAANIFFIDWLTWESKRHPFVVPLVYALIGYLLEVPWPDGTYNFGESGGHSIINNWATWRGLSCYFKTSAFRTQMCDSGLPAAAGRCQEGPARPVGVAKAQCRRSPSKSDVSGQQVFAWSICWEGDETKNRAMSPRSAEQISKHFRMSESDSLPEAGSTGWETEKTGQDPLQGSARKRHPGGNHAAASQQTGGCKRTLTISPNSCGLLSLETIRMLSLTLMFCCFWQLRRHLQAVVLDFTIPLSL